MKNSAITKLFFKLALIGLPFAVVFILVMFFTPYITELQKAKMQDKVDRLILQASTSPQVIIAGDSRAEANVMPLLFTQESGLSGVNIATGNEVLGQVYDTLDSNGLLNKHNLLIISVSLFAINDAARDYQPIDKAVVDTEPWNTRKAEDLFVYWRSYVHYYVDRFKDDLQFTSTAENVRMPDAVAQAKGYLVATDGGLIGKTTIGDPFEPYNKDYRIGGLKEREFIKTLEQLGSTTDTVVIYLGPLAPLWKESMDETSKERNDYFASLIKKTVARYPNLYFINFETEDTSTTLPNEKFGDQIHLNSSGAATFTTLLVHTLQSNRILHG